MLYFNQQGYTGTYWERNRIITGIWYCGIPFFRAYKSNINSVALFFMLGAHWGNLMCPYSYDFSLSKMVVKSGGSHEVTVTWKWYS